MKSRALLLLIVLILPVMAVAQGDRPPIDLRVYPGGESTMEMNMSNEDILVMLKAMLPFMGDKLGKIGEALDPDEIALIFKDVRRIEFLQVDVAKPGATERDVADFYAKNLPSGQWMRVFWQSKDPAGTMAVFSQSNAEVLYGFRVRTVPTENGSVKRAEIAKIEGKIDYPKLISLAAKVLAAKAAGK